MTKCAWCDRPAGDGVRDEQGDPCCRECKPMGKLETAGAAAKRNGVSALVLAHAARAPGLQRYLAPEAWDQLAKHLSN